jgi:transcriptional regulator with XRE-family HTH domain
MLSPVKTPRRFDPETIAARMRWGREHRGFTLESLGERVGLAADTLRKKEKAENPFYLDEIARICDVLEAPTLFPFMDWGEAKLADKLLGREPPSR